MGGPLFDEIRAEHHQVLEAVARLEQATRREGSDPGFDQGALVASLEDFLSFYESTVLPHMKREEAEVYPLLERYLPAEIGSAEAMLQEHETLGSLVGLLRRDLSRLRTGATETAPEIVAVAQDLAALLRDHIRKEDNVLNPLLERLLREGRHA